MQQKYLEHYIAKLFHKWLMNICSQVGDSPFRSVVQNFMYYQDPEDPSKVRLQSFIAGLTDFIEKVKLLEDPDPAPPLTIVEMDAFLEAQRAAKYKFDFVEITTDPATVAFPVPTADVSLLGKLKI